jgi:hypothetical protein
MTETRTCPQCGAAAPAGIKFCGACGFNMAQGATSPPGGAKPKRTMIGMQVPVGTSGAPPSAPSPAAPPGPAPTAPSSPAAAQPAPTTPPGASPKGAAASKAPQRTMLGMPAVGRPPGAQDAPPSTPSPGAAVPGGGSPPPAQAPPAGAPDPHGQTPAAGVALPAQRTAAPGKGAAQRTMLGMPAVQAPPPGGSPSPATPPTGGAGPAQAPAPAKTPGAGPVHPSAGEVAAPAGPTKRTMLGMAGVASAGVPGPAGAPGAGAPAGAGPAGGEAQGAPAAFAPAAGSTPSPDADADSWDEPVGRQPGRLRLGLGLGLAAVALLLIGGGLVAYVVLGSGPDLRAAVVQTDEGEALRVDVPGAPDGTRVRFAGQQQDLEAARAHFPLTGSGLAVGDNKLVVDVVYPDGRVEEVRITLTLDYRVRAELDALDETPSSFTLRVDAPPGSQVVLDGEPLALDVRGKGSRRVPVGDLDESAGPDGTFEHQAEYRIELPEGEPASGTVRTRIPYTTLQIDKPGHDVITDREVVEIAGAVHPNATVEVDGEDVEVTGGRFLTQYALEETGEHTVTIVAHQAGRVPRRDTIRIRRVADLLEAARDFRADEGLGYARIAQNPNIYRGRKIEMTGRLYNVEVGGGKSVLQMLVKDCPKGERCPLWIQYDAATDLTVQSWARVLGEVAGEQQFRAESGRVLTVPRVHAKLVLPADK